MSIFEAHFRRLHARYGAGQTHELQMQEIAAIFGCSVRNCRIALKKMHQEKCYQADKAKFEANAENQLYKGDAESKDEDRKSVV